MLRAKYQAHRLVNILFYAIMWFSGFLVGFGLKGSGVNENFKEIFTSIFS